MFIEPDEHQEIRDAVRQLCRACPDECFREVDAKRACPEACVDALIEAGWLAQMMPEGYGDTGRGLTVVTVIIEGINRAGGSAGAVHGQRPGGLDLARAALGPDDAPGPHDADGGGEEEE